MTSARRSLKSVDDLVTAGFVTSLSAPALGEVAQKYAIAVTPEMAQLIDINDPADPIARQFVPSASELLKRPEETSDPISDTSKSPLPGLVHRYPDRVLLKISGVCPVYCRFCFRREMIGPGHDAVLPDKDIANALDYIRAHKAIWEVIVTGGDPLAMSPRRIVALTRSISAIEHVKIIRWHSRVPVVAPAMITNDLADALSPPVGKTVVVAVHANHPRELTDDARRALAVLGDAGIMLVSQTVLLRGINDNVGTLEALMRAFVEARVKPYYLHHGDLAPGTSHFRTTLAEGQRLMAELRGRLSGLAMPTYVLDIPGAYGKVPINSNSAKPRADGSYDIVDAARVSHTYRDVI